MPPAKSNTWMLNPLASTVRGNHGVDRGTNPSYPSCTYLVARFVTTLLIFLVGKLQQGVLFQTLSTLSFPLSEHLNVSLVLFEGTFHQEPRGPPQFLGSYFETSPGMGAQQHRPQAPVPRVLGLSGAWEREGAGAKPLDLKLGGQALGAVYLRKTCRPFLMGRQKKGSPCLTPLLPASIVCWFAPLNGASQARVAGVRTLFRCRFMVPYAPQFASFILSS